MMNKNFFKESNLKTFSRIGSRATFGMAALELIKDYPNLNILTADVSTSAGLDKFRKNYPENYVDVGIAEQNMIGVATGLANEGFPIITTTFSPFQTMRCCEQIKVNLGYMKKNITMVGLASGLVLGTLGYTHCSIEDIGVLRSIPNINIVSPADCFETIKALKSSLDNKQSTYIRLTGGVNNPQVYFKDYKFKIGKSIKVNEGKKITIFANGTMVHECLMALKILKKKNINPTIINMHTIKPIDEKSIISACENSKMIVTVEEHNVIGGLGSAVSEVISRQKKQAKQLFIGVNDQYSKGGTYEDLKEKFGLTYKKIALNIQKNL